ncbi:hypothetical protein J7412_07585 [Shimia sp. R9_3]|nr:hypothetical protein [Shimia sp. R9_3]
MIKRFIVEIWREFLFIVLMIGMILIYKIYFPEKFAASSYSAAADFLIFCGIPFFLFYEWVTFDRSAEEKRGNNDQRKR